MWRPNALVYTLAASSCVLTAGSYTLLASDYYVLTASSCVLTAGSYALTTELAGEQTELAGTLEHQNSTVSKLAALTLAIELSSEVAAAEHRAQSLAAELEVARQQTTAIRINTNQTAQQPTPSHQQAPQPLTNLSRSQSDLAPHQSSLRNRRGIQTGKLNLKKVSTLSQDNETPKEEFRFFVDAPTHTERPVADGPRHARAKSADFVACGPLPVSPLDELRSCVQQQQQEAELALALAMEAQPRTSRSSTARSTPWGTPKNTPRAASELVDGQENHEGNIEFCEGDADGESESDMESDSSTGSDNEGARPLGQSDDAGNASSRRNASEHEPAATASEPVNWRSAASQGHTEVQVCVWLLDYLLLECQLLQCNLVLYLANDWICRLL